MNTSFAAAGPGRWSVRLTRRYPHPIETVWQAVSNPVQLGAWFPATVAFDDGKPLIGSKIRFGEPMDGIPALSGTVTDCAPPHLLAFTWDTDHLRFELSPVAGGTELALIHTFDDRAGAASFASGWDGCIGALGADLTGEPAPEWNRGESRHEELVAAFGLDAATVDEIDDRGQWRIVFERQMVAPADVVWHLILGVDPATQQQRPAPKVGEPFAPWAAPTHVLGTVTEIDPGRVLAWDTSVDEPGDTVRIELVDGTGHGARMIVTITGSAPQDRDVARSQWRDGVANTAAEALDHALATNVS